MQITEFTVEEIIDPTGFIQGQRYEFHLYAMLSEEDELYTPNGIGIRTILMVGDGDARLGMTHFFDRATDEVLTYELEDEELASILTFCLEEIAASSENDREATE